MTFHNFVEALYLMEPIVPYSSAKLPRTKVGGMHRVTLSQFPFYEYAYFDRKGSIFAVKNVHSPKKRTHEQRF